jgi:hypothetical protein
MIHSLTRRQFVEFSSLLLLQACVHTNITGSKKSQTKYLITSAPNAWYGHSDEFVVTPPGSISIFNLEAQTTSKIKIDFFGHTILQNLVNKNLVYTFGQYGMLGALIDLDSEKCIKYINAARFCTFMGHADFIENKNIIYTTEHDHNKLAGYVVFRDPSSLKELSRFESGGGLPHDTTFLKDQNTIVVINARGPSSIVYLDINNGKVLNKIYLQDGQFGNYSHFEISADGWIIALPRRTKSRINLIDPGGKTFLLDHPETDTPGALSHLFIKNSSYVVVTCPEAGFVQIWNYKTQQSIANIKLSNPRGLIQVESAQIESHSFLVSLANTNSIVLITIEKNQKVTTNEFRSEFGGKGSHMINLKT